MQKSACAGEAGVEEVAVAVETCKKSLDRRWGCFGKASDLLCQQVKLLCTNRRRRRRRRRRLRNRRGGRSLRSGRGGHGPSRGCLARRHRVGIPRGGGNKEEVLEETIGGGSVERSFKNKGTVKTQPLPLAPILLVQKPACVGEAGVEEVAVAVGTCKGSLNRRWGCSGKTLRRSSQIGRAHV